CQYHATEGKTVIAAKSQSDGRFRKFQRHFCHTRNKSGAPTTAVGNLIRSANEIAIAAPAKSIGLSSSIQRRKKYKPISARLSEGTSGMKERPAKTFSGAKLKKNVGQRPAVPPKISATSKKKNGSEKTEESTGQL